MPRNTRKETRWGKVRGWHARPFSCWDAEWSEYCRAAEAAGKSVNGWMRDGLKEIVRYERVANAERDDPAGDRPQ